MAKRAVQAIVLGNRGFRSVRASFTPGVYRRELAREFWGFPAIPGLVICSFLCLLASYLIPFGLRQYNPFSMSFPSQAGSMAFALMGSPLTLFALVCGWRIRRGTQQSFRASGPEIMAAVGVPMLVSGALIPVVLQGLSSYPILLDGIRWTHLIHAASNMVFLGAWLTFFCAATGMGNSWGFGKILGVFFSYHAFFFARSFIPHFGVLDLIASNFFHPNSLGVEWHGLLISMFKALLGGGAICVFWIVFQEKLMSRIKLEANLPPIPTQPI